MEIILGDGTHFEAERLEKEAWLAYLYYTENHGINMERVDSVEQVCGRETLSYVFRTLEILEQDFKAGKLSQREYEIVKLVLEWAEVAKGGTVKEREQWRQQGYALDIHNVASAGLFLSHFEENAKAALMPAGNREKTAGVGHDVADQNVIATLIRTHGLIGQALRGEVLVAGNGPLLSVKEALGEEAAYRILTVLNHCIIGGNTLTLSQTEANAVSCNNPASFVNCLAPVQINGTCRTGDLGFQNAAAYDFHITASSAALDAGSPAAASFLSDLDGFPRPSGAGPDIGCYEFDSSSASIALVADATEGLAPFAVNFSITVIGLSDAASYAWDLDGDGTADETTAAPTLSHTFQTSGSFAITVSALDALGAVLATSGNIVTVSAYPATVYVNASSATPAAPYDTPATAATTLQAALGATIGGATVLVADGAYPLTASVLIDKGVRVVGNDGDPSRVVFRRSGNANFRLFTLNHPDAVLSGLTLEGGRLNSSGECGANLMVSSLGGTATNCVIRGGYADGYNGGGGGVHIVGGATAGLVTHCVISNNSASVTASDCNESRSGGAGLNIAGGTVRNCLVAYNYQNPANTLGKLFGGAAIVRGGTLESCTVANNSARICAGVYATAGSVLNCAIANNTPTASATEQYAVWAGDASLFSHCVSPVSINASCIVEAAPLTAPGAGDFTLAAGSHAIDAADAAAWMSSAKDLAGNARIQGEGPDIGAYEADAAAFAASFSADNDTGFAPLAVHFAFTAVNGGGAGYALEWYEEGESVPYSTTRVQGDAATIAQTFADVGSHNVVLKVEDLATGATFIVPGYVTIYAAPRTVHVVPAGTPFIPLPHEAFSGRCFRKGMKNLIGSNFAKEFPSC